MKQLDILFINPNASESIYQGLANIYSAIEPPTWALLLAQSCRSKGFVPAILDCDAEHLTNEDAFLRIRDISPRLICFVVYGQNPNSGTTTMEGAIKLAQYIKSNSDYKICFVGSHTSALPLEVLSYTCVDFVLLNEGVYALHNLLASDLQSVSQIKGIGHKTLLLPELNQPEKIVPQDRMDIDLPGYAWDLLPYKNKPFDLYRSHFWHADFNHDLRTPFASIYTSLGCRFKCLVGDTLINTIYGKVKIKELAKYSSVPIYTYDPNTGEPVIVDATHICKTGSNQDVVRVEFDDGTHIDCTPDHKIMTFINGNQHKKVEEIWVEAQNLRPGTSVRSMREYQSRHGYNIVQCRRKQAKRNGRLVLEYRLGRKLSPQEQVHHIDGNKLNDHPDNLQYMASAKEHSKYHPEIAERMRLNNPSKYVTEQGRRLGYAKNRTHKRTLVQKLKYRNSKLGHKNPNYIHGRNIGQPSRIAEINHKVVKVTPLPNKCDVYCMSVPKYTSFFANNVLVKNCSFCMINILNRTSNNEGTNAAHSNIMRFWSPNFIIQEFDKLASYGVETIRISDEMFFLDKRYFEPLLSLIVDRQYSNRLRMWTYSRIDTVRDKYLELFKRAGINWLALGIEAGNQNVRQEVTKGSFKDINIRDVVSKIRDFDINVIANYIYGLPDDNLETMQQTLDLAIELNTEMYNAYPAMALPGSPLYYEAKQQGWKLPGTFSAWSFLSYDCEPLPTKYLSSAQVLEFRDASIDKYFNRPQYLDMIENKFGIQQRQNIIDMLNVKLYRRLLQCT